MDKANADTKPQALAVGEQGLLIGCFDGQWKLMRTGVANDLHGVWSSDDTAYVVGDNGTVLRIEDGRCQRLDVPTDYDLRDVWGLGAAIGLRRR